MGIQEKIDAIREECIKANPSRGWQEEVTRIDVKELPVRLADVLLAAEKSYGLIIKSDGYFVDTVPECGLEKEQIFMNGRYEDIKWNLAKDDLAHQNEPAINFIHKVLFRV